VIHDSFDLGIFCFIQFFFCSVSFDSPLFYSDQFDYPVCSYSFNFILFCSPLLCSDAFNAFLFYSFESVLFFI